MKVRPLIAAIAAMFALQSGMAIAAPKASGKAATSKVSKPAAKKAAATAPVRKAAVKPAPKKGVVAKAAASDTKAARSAKAATRASANARGKAPTMRVSLRKPAVAAAALAAPAAVLADEPDTPVALDGSGMPVLASNAFYVINQRTGEVLLERNATEVLPIASITKLMTAMVALDAKPALDEVLEVSDEDIDQLKGTRSRLAIGTRLTREEMLHLALMSSENRASSALSRYYPGGHAAFIAAMNRKARDLGLADTQFFDSTGLNPRNVSSARDLAKMVAASASYPLIREFSTTRDGYFAVNGRMVHFNNTNALVSNPEWEIGLQKTGFTNEAGKCLVMQAWMNQKPVVIVLLDSWGKLTRIGDANRIRRWVEQVAQQGARQG